jgi:hypothetical protein
MAQVLPSEPVAQLTAELENKLLERLMSEWDDLNWSLFRSTLRPPQFILLDGDSRLGEWCRTDRSIGLSRRAIVERPWSDTLETLKHEMAHQFVDEVLGGDEAPHGPRFRQVCIDRGIDPAATAGPAPRVDASREDRIIDRVRKLLALAESSNQHEAELAASTAQRLILKFNIDLKSRPRPTDAYAHAHVGVPTGRVQVHQRTLASLLIEHFFVRGIWVTTYQPLEGKKGTVLEICGRPENVQMAEFVHDFVLRTVERLWKEHKKAHGIRSNRDRRSFMAGAVSGFSAKLREKRAEAQREGLVWVRDAGVDAYVKRRHPRLVSCGYRPKGDRNAYAQGHSAGRTIVLSRPMTSGSDGGPRKALPRGRG